MIWSLLKSGLSVGLLRLIGAGLGFLITVTLGRFLGPEGLGKFALISTILMIVAVPVSQAFGTLVLRATSTARIQDNWGEVRGLSNLGLVLALIIAILFAGIGAVTYEFQIAQLIIISLAAIILFLDQGSALRAATLRGLDRPVLAFGPEMIIRPGLFLILIGVWFTIYGTLHLPAVLLLLAIAAFANFAVGSWILNRKRPERLGRDPVEFHLPKWFKSAVPLAAGSGLMLIFVQVDILMLGWLAPAEVLGIYRVAFQIALLSGLAYTALNLVVAERFATHFASGDQTALRSSAKLSARTALVCALPVPIFMLIFGKEFIALVFGSEFASAYIPVLILCLTHLISAGFGMARSLLVMGQEEKRVFWWTIPALILNLVFCFVLIPSLGAVGAAIAVLIATIIWNASLWWQARTQLQIDSSAMSGIPIG